MSNYFTGVSFPFRFDATGSTTKVTLTPDDYSLIQQSLYQIWFTSKYERMMEVDIGTPTRKMLFEVNGDVTELAILKHEMMKSAEGYEDRVIVNDITFKVPDDQPNTLVIYVDCTITKFMTDTTLVMSVDLNQL